MKKKSLNNLASRRRAQLKIRHQQILNRQKQFFIFLRPQLTNNNG
ncbi:hypothetical protein [Shewanella sp. Isolate11]|nr:hypothetical protein [Shewanella sp. Isolate11]